MQNAIACNAKAIHRMESSDFEGAFNLLRASMMSLTGTNLLPSVADKSPLDQPDSIFNWETPDDVIIVSTNNDPEFSRFYAGTFLFTLPLHNSAGSAAVSRADHYSPRQVDYCSAICLFNMGLACHLESEVCSDVARKNKLVHQARVLYLTAYQLLQKYPVEPAHSVVLLLMVLCANLIDIELELGNLSEIRFWRNILEDASSAADPVVFVGRPVYSFFDTVYVAPGDLHAARAA